MRVTIAEVAEKLSDLDRREDPSLILRQVRHMAARGLLSDARSMDGRGTQSFPLTALYEARVLRALSGFGIVENEAMREVSRQLSETPFQYGYHSGHIPARCRTAAGSANLRPALEEAAVGTQLNERWSLLLTRRPVPIDDGIKEWSAHVLPFLAAVEEIQKPPKERDFLGAVHVSALVDLSALFNGLPSLTDEV